jgi:hypothetical protein
MVTRFLLFLFCILLLKAPDVPAQVRSQPNRTTLVKKQQKFSHYGQDFLDFAKSEYEPSFDLGQVASTNVERLDSAKTLLEIYDNLSCPQDRTAPRELIQSEFVFYSKEVALDIKTVNLIIAHAQKPGVAAEAAQMRDDLRELQDLFDSIRLP